MTTGLLCLFVKLWHKRRSTLKSAQQILYKLQVVRFVLTATSHSDGAITADNVSYHVVVAITSCAGPRTYFYVGRKDSSVPSPEGQLPNSESTAQQQIDACKAKGFTTTDLVAMVGAHSAGVSQQGLSFDSTPEKLDSTVFYPETASEKGPTSLQSDYALSNDTQTKTAWKNMGRSNALWRAQFVTT